ncbi:hypothetical protein FHR37_000841 [Actinopolymorpha cephalotaxi]|uniref:1,4-alpha-glucan branching enzyme n=1 Tax=Actinopolymorpha cephalotaxi TaxID=504797 RepID=A0ABX2S0R5_9ACTN|nr:hypothetical protein [Actinopolymorpha cephalotaxi]
MSDHRTTPEPSNGSTSKRSKGVGTTRPRSGAAEQAGTEQTGTPRPTGEPPKVDPAEIDRLVDGDHHAPHTILGPHVHEGEVTLRVLRPMAERVSARVGDQRVELEHEHNGVWVGTLPGSEVPDYRLEVGYPHGVTVPADDPYRFLPTLGDVDLHLIGEGRHENLWQVLGAHVRSYETPNGTVTGTSFAVWAPNARGVRVVGDSTAGTAGRTRCAHSAAAACGSCSSPTSATAPSTATRSSAATVCAGRSPTRWPSTPRCRRRTRRWCTPPGTTGATRSGWPGGPPPSSTPRR